MSTADTTNTARPASNLIGGTWQDLATPAAHDAPGAIVSTNPAHPDRVLWAGVERPSDVDAAVAAAREALPEWSGWDIERRARVLQRFAELCDQHVDQVGGLICDETGKALWDAMGEAKALGGKVGLTLDTAPEAGRARVTGFELPLSDTRTGTCTFRPHGVMAVVGPFNFPCHLPNGHIVPALLMGNTVVLKPSDKTPACGQRLVELLHEALEAEGAPAGVLNLVQGGVSVAKPLVAHSDIDGVLFTGSWPVGRAILEANLDHPGRIIALELGGNNPVIVMPDADLRQAAIEVARGAFITTGQRCTCTRRLMVHESIAESFTTLVLKAASMMIVGDPRSEHPVFMGPTVTREARDAVFNFQQSVAKAGGRILMESTPVESPGNGWFLTPGMAKVDRFSPNTCPRGSAFDAGCDQEIFGPFLRVATATDFEDALVQANATQYGLAGSLFTRDAALVQRFFREGRAGCLNVNTATAGASSKLPFGGLGKSGNHRPAGSFALDYCAAPVAGMHETGDGATIAPGMTFDDAWLG